MGDNIIQANGFGPYQSATESGLIAGTLSGRAMAGSGFPHRTRVRQPISQRKEY